MESWDNFNRGRHEIEDEITPQLSLENLTLSLFKEFVSKDNRERHRKYANDQNYSQYNKALIAMEFIGHKLYSLAVNTPKTYIAVDEEGEFKLNSLKKPTVKTLNQYLCDAIRAQIPDWQGERIEDVNFLQPDVVSVLRQALNHLPGIGRLCLMAIWLQDKDVFGKRLDNVLVDNDGVVKIDTSEIDLGKQEDFEVSLQSLKQHAYHSQEEMPFFLLIYNLLDDQQKEDGLRAIASLKDTVLKEMLEWLGQHFDVNTKEIFEELRSRRNNILINFGMPSNIPLAKVSKQDVVIRPASDFEDTSQVIVGGNSNPIVTQKVRSDKKDKLNLFMFARSMIDLLMQSLKDSLKSIDGADQKVKLQAAIEQYSNLYTLVESKIQTSEYKRADITHIYKTFNKIFEEVLPALQSSQKSSNFIAKFLSSPKVTKKNESIEPIAKLFNDKYQGFFQKTFQSTRANDNEFPSHKKHNH